MGMYTELIVGCTLTKDLPVKCVSAFKHIIDGIVVSPEDEEVTEFIKEYNLYKILWSESCYFGSPSHCVFKREEYGYNLSLRANLKNYNGEIEKFLKFLLPYVKWGSGVGEIFAMTMYEEDFFPVLWFKNGVIWDTNPEVVHDLEPIKTENNA